MSRGFVKEEDQEEAPIIPPRAALPNGAVNYVTPFGHQALKEEKKNLEEARKNRPDTNEDERRRTAAVIDGKLKLLNDRLASARIVEPSEQTSDQIRFGANVELMNTTDSSKMNFQIVGVDEADVKQQKIAFVAPISRAVIGKKKGEIAELELGGKTRKLKILSIHYS